MSESTATEDSKDVRDQLIALSEQTELASTYLRKLQHHLAKAIKDTSAGRHIAAMRKLARDLKDLEDPPTLPQAGAFVPRVEAYLELHASLGLDTFMRSMVERASESGVDAKLLPPDRLAIGPFALTPDLRKDQAELSYAKVAVAQVPLDADVVLKTVRQLSDELLKSTDHTVFAKRLDEAMRVTAARTSKPVTGRAELPAVFRELRAMAMMESRPRQYSMARFVVELKAFVQSDTNLQGRRRFRLETAVLENAKDQTKSVFVPTEASAGYGEGTYFQAVVIENAA